MIVHFFCPVCGQFQGAGEPYIGMEEIPEESYGFPCKTCRENALKTNTVIVEPHILGEEILPEKLMISDNAFKKVFGKNPPDSKMMVIKKGKLSEIQFTQGIFFVKSVKGDARFRQ